MFPRFLKIISIFNGNWYYCLPRSHINLTYALATQIPPACRGLSPKIMRWGYKSNFTYKMCVLGRAGGGYIVEKESPSSSSVGKVSHLIVFMASRCKDYSRLDIAPAYDTTHDYLQFLILYLVSSFTTILIRFTIKIIFNKLKISCNAYQLYPRVHIC